MTQEEALTILKAGRNIFLTGRAGSGKTYVLNQYIEYLRDRDIEVAVTASTGIAATHLGGVTIHSWSGMGIKDYLEDFDIDHLTQKESLYKKYKRNKVLIIDEVSMLKPAFFDSLNRLCKTMKQNQKPFGGMQIILSGDFFQLPPIFRYGEECCYIDSSESWSDLNLRVCYLDEQYRQTDDKLSKILTEIRCGDVSEESIEILSTLKKKKNKSKIIPTKLYTHNIDVDAVNQKKLSEIKTREQVYKIKTHGRQSAVNALLKSLLVPEQLCLKKEAIVMFVKNNFETGYVNGTLGTVVGFEYGCPIVETFAGKIIQVQKEVWEIEDDGKIIASAEQFPLRLAWAITIHKSQGMSLDAAEIDLSKSFVPGQGYVALSRLRTLDGLFLIGINDTALKVDPYVLRLDEILRRDSDRWSKAICNFSEDEICEMHSDFLKKNDTEKCNKSKNKKILKKIADAAAKSAAAKSGAKSAAADGSDASATASTTTSLNENSKSHEITLELLEMGINLEKIASEREVKIGTIVSHLEKIKEMDRIPSQRFKKLCANIKPAKKTLQEIKKIYQKNPDAKLAVLYSKLGGKYSFEEIRVARLFFY